MNYFILCLSLKIFISSLVLKHFLVDIAISLVVTYSQCLKYNILHFLTFKDSIESLSVVMINTDEVIQKKAILIHIIFQLVQSP